MKQKIKERDYANAINIKKLESWISANYRLQFRQIYKDMQSKHMVLLEEREKILKDKKMIENNPLIHKFSFGDCEFEIEGTAEKLGHLRKSLDDMKDRITEREKILKSLSDHMMMIQCFIDWLPGHMP